MDDFFVGELAGAGVGGFEGFANGDHESDDMALGELDDFGDFVGVESDHGAGVVAHGFGGEHDGLCGNANGAHRFVALELGVVAIEGLDHGDDDFADGVGGVGPVTFGVVVGVEVGAQDKGEGGVGDLCLIECGGAESFFFGGVGDRDEAPVLHIKGGGGTKGRLEELADLGLAEGVVGVVVFNGAAFADCSKGFHGA